MESGAPLDPGPRLVRLRAGAAIVHSVTSRQAIGSPLRPNRSASHPARRRTRLSLQYELVKSTEVIRRYIDAWNGRDAEALVAAFAQEGKFCNPHTYPGIGGEALAEFVKGVWTAFPDFHLKLLNCDENRVRFSAIH
jgi:SnoaL-like protein